MEALYAFLLKFADDHWFILWCFGFLAWAPVWLAAVLIGLVSSLYIRTCRLLIVAVRGWPPAHLDADGDWKPEPKVETKTETSTIGDMTHTTIRSQAKN